MKRSNRVLPVVFALVALTGCGRGTDGVSPAAPLTPTEERGELLSYACQACHSLDAGGPSQIGPNLFAMFGREAGSVEGFDYSPAMRDLDLVWTSEALDRWLADPVGFLPGTTMAFTGYRSAEDRRALIAYLEQRTRPVARGAGE